MIGRVVLLLVGIAVVPRAMWAQSPPECRKIVIERLSVEGANHLPSTFRGQLAAFLRHQSYSECTDWIGDLENRVLRAENEGWPNRENEGYVGLAVGGEWKLVSEDAGLLRVVVTVRVDEGQQKRLSKVEFRTVGPHSVPPVVAPIIATEELRRLIPLGDGAIFNAGKVREGLEAVARAYGAKGFIECTVTSNMDVDQTNQTIAITLDLNEGPLYRVGSLEITGLDAATARLLQSKLAIGEPVNPKLIEDFFAENKSRLPPGASPQAVVWKRDKQRAVVNFSFDFRTATAAHD